MLKVTYPAALSGNVDQRVVYLSGEDLAALRSGSTLRPPWLGNGLPLVIALGGETDAETARVLTPTPAPPTEEG